MFESVQLLRLPVSLAINDTKRSFTLSGDSMTKEAYLSLRHSESVVADMSATIFAAYVQNKEVNEFNEDEFVKKSVDIAVKLASYADKVVKSDGEWMKQERGSSLTL
jgi:hypothetical protein